MDGVAVDEMKREELAIKQQRANDVTESEKVENWSKRLRKRGGKINYKE